MKGQLKKKKPFYWKIINIFSISFAFILLLFTLVSLNVNKDYGNGFLGYKFYIVLSDSMKPEFQAGDIVIVKAIDVNQLKSGDIITYYVGDGTVVTHQIVIKDNETFITKGMNVEQVDENPVSPNKIIGKYVFPIPKAGDIVSYLKTKLGFFLCIMTPMFLIVLVSGYQFLNNLKSYINKRKEDEAMKKNLLEKNKQLSQEIIFLKEQMNNTSHS